MSSLAGRVHWPSDARWIASGICAAVAPVSRASWIDGPTMRRSATACSPGRRVDDIRLDAGLEPLDERRPLALESREGRVTGGIRGAAGEEEIERGLAVGRDPLQDRHVERRRAVEHRDADMLGVLAEVVLGEGPAIRRPVQVDLVVPERRPDVIEVVRRDRARVEARVGIECGQAVAHPRRRAARRPRRPTARSCRASAGA